MIEKIIITKKDPLEDTMIIGDFLHQLTPNQIWNSFWKTIANTFDKVFQQQIRVSVFLQIFQTSYPRFLKLTRDLFHRIGIQINSQM